MLLTAREKIVLGEIVKHFIDSASPVSSTLIAQKSRLSFSPATIRNIMADLEIRGYIFQPHTSAGRVPKTRGYRAYVDTLMKKTRLSSSEKEQISDTLCPGEHEIEDILKEVSRILAHLSHQLGVLVSPKIEEGIFQRMELIPLSSDKILIIISIDSGFVKTISIEIDSMIPAEKLYLVSRILNERLSNMKIEDIRKKFASIVKDIKDEETGLVKMFSNRADRLFDFQEETELYFMGAHHIMQSPDFSDVTSISSVMEMLETRREIVDLLDKATRSKPASVKIGEEFEEEKLQDFSLITARYSIGGISGVLGIIGPKRMNYSKFISLVEYTARSITDIYGKN